MAGAAVTEFVVGAVIGWTVAAYVEAVLWLGRRVVEE